MVKIYHIFDYSSVSATLEAAFAELLEAAFAESGLAV
jgi:hypothetical protein